MRILVTGSSGHLGAALVRVLQDAQLEPVGLDRRPGPDTRWVGDITDPRLVREALEGAHAVVHAAALHKPHLATHPGQPFVQTNVAGTLELLEQAVDAGVGRFVFTSTTSAFGAALTPAPGAPAVWVDEGLLPVPKNLYGVTKVAAEDLCHLVHRTRGLACVVLRTSRFFPEEDDHRATREAYADENVKANEYLFRRVDLEDVATAHLAALRAADRIGFGRYVISATTPLLASDAAALSEDAVAVVRRRVPAFAEVYRARGYRMFPTIGRVYDNARARAELGWTPRHDFAWIVEQLAAGEPIGSRLAREVGSRGYHDGQRFEDGPYPVAVAGEDAP